MPAERDRPPTPSESMAWFVRNDRHPFPDDVRVERAWPRFPLDAPWPVLLMLVADAQPLREREEVWRRFVDAGEFRTYGEYIGGIAQQFDMQSARRLSPFPFSYGSIQMMWKDGGVCGTMGNIGARTDRICGIPASTAGQPGHCAVVLMERDAATGEFRCRGDQYATGGDEVTSVHAPWNLDERGARRPMVFHQSVAWGVNHGFASYVEALAMARAFAALPPEARAAECTAFAEAALALNPFAIASLEAAVEAATDAASLRTIAARFDAAIAALDRPERFALLTKTIREAIDALLATSPASLAADPPAAATPELARWAETRDARMAWWRDARFGMFIHWGLYSAAGGFWEGKRYEQHYAEWIQHWAAVPCGDYACTLKSQFLPEPGATDAWADLARDAGMRYAVMTSKHHDGFTLFNSIDPYSLANPITGGTNISPPGRDLAREFADSMRSRGLRAGFYYSLLDWQHPDAYEMALPAYPRVPGPRDHAKYIDYVRTHVDELLSGYGPLSTIWFDYSDATRNGEAWGATRLLEDLRVKQPAIVVNNRLYEGLENKNGDYGTPEKYVPPTGLPGMDWEVNHTLNESYGFSAHDANWKDTATVVRLLSDIVSKGGNLLLNIGPDAKGRVPEPAAATLRGVGEWMRVNGEAIYGTTASPFQRLAWGRATRKPGVLYLHVWDWPSDGRLVVPMQGKVRSARLLGQDQDASLAAAPSEAEGGRLVIELPASSVDAAVSVLRLDLDGDVEPMPFLVFPSPGGRLTLTPHDATLEGPSIRVERVGVIGDVTHNIGYWLDPAATATWPVGIGAAQGGNYRVEAELACADAAAGSRMVLEMEGGRGTLEFTVPATGGWQSYRRVELGLVELPFGSHRAILRALSKPGEAVVNVRSITLRKE